MPNKMLKIVAISDTHRKHREVEVPDGDVLIHAGDITSSGEMGTIKDFAAWMKELPHCYKIVISGNHDKIFEVRDKTHAKSIKNRFAAIELLQEAGAIYLEDSGTEIEGIKIWGSPCSPFFFNWAFNYQRGEEIAKVWAKIPEDTNLLIAYSPPYGILDEVEKFIGVEHIGCLDLLKRIEALKELKAVVFGHKHRDYNESPVIKNGITFVNASILNNKYEVANNPVIIDMDL